MCRRRSLVFALLPGAMAVSTPAGHAQVSSAGPLVPGAPAGVTAFVNVTVIPMDAERVLADHTVLVEGGRITALGPASQIRIPAGAVRIDGRGKFLLPGLADMHAHLFGYDSVMLERRLLQYLADGVTTLRGVDFGSRPQAKWEDRLLRFRARAAAGTILSPRLSVSGTWWGDELPRASIGRKIVQPESTAAYLAAYKAKGFDHVKTYGETKAVKDSLAVVARRLGLPLVGHAVGVKDGAEWMLAAYRSLEHVSGYFYQDAQNHPDTAKIRTLAEATRRAGVWFCPTLEIKTRRRPGSKANATYRAIVQSLQAAGPTLLLGTDDFLESSIGPITVHHELEALVRIGGLTPYQALVTGTQNVASYFGTLHEAGTVAVGKRADLVLLNGNPLEDIKHAARPTGVMLGGRWILQSEIARRLATSTMSGAAPNP